MTLLRRILDYARDRTGALGLGLGLRIGGGRPPGGGGNGGGEGSTTPGAFLQDGVWNQWIEPRAVRYVGSSDRTYFGAVGDAGEVRVGAYDHDSDEIETFQLSTTQADDHSAPAILVDSSGVLHCFYAKHDTEGTMYYRQASAAESVAAFAAEVEISVSGAVTYAQAFQAAGGRIVVFCRAGDSPRRWYEFHSDDDGDTWSTPRAWLGGTGIDFYYLIARQHADLDTLSVAFSEHPDTGTNHDIGFAHIDLSDGAISTPDDGTEIANIYSGDVFVPFGPDNESLLVYEVSEGQTARLWDVSADDEVVFMVWDEGGGFANAMYHYVQVSGAGAVGTVRSLVAPGATVDDAATARGYFGGMALTDTEGVVLLAREASGTWTVERWTTADGGASWSDEELDSTSQTKAFRPVAPRNAHDDLPALWCIGAYTSYTDYATNMRGARPAVAGSIARTSVGLLPRSDSGFARHEFDDAAYAFDVDHWANTTVRSIEVLGTGVLRFEPDAGMGVWCASRYSDLGSRSKTLLFARFRNGGDSAWIGLGHHIEETADPDMVRGSLEWGGDRMGLVEYGGSESQVDDAGIASKSFGTIHDLSMWADAGDARLYSHSDDFASELSFSTITLSGRVGWVMTAAALAGEEKDLYFFFAMADRYVTITGLETGQVVKVLQPNETVVAQATESGGTATVDLMEAMFYGPRKPHYIQVFGSDGSRVTDPFHPDDAGAEGVWGGDVCEAS